MTNPLDWSPPPPVADQLETIGAFLSQIVQDAVVPQVIAAETAFVKQHERGLGPDEVDPDGLIGAWDLARTTEIAFYLFGFAYFEAQSTELANRLRQPRAPLANFKKAIQVLQASLGDPACGIERINELLRLRNRLAHDGGELSPLGVMQLEGLLARGEVHPFMIDGIAFGPDFVLEALTDLAATYTFWMDQWERRPSP